MVERCGYPVLHLTEVEKAGATGHVQQYKGSALTNPLCVATSHRKDRRLQYYTLNCESEQHASLPGILCDQSVASSGSEPDCIRLK